MNVLLDTHALLWWLKDDERLGPAAREVIADPATTILVSAVSLWEIVVKLRVGKLDVNVEAVIEAVGQQDFTWLDIQPTHLNVLAGMPTKPDHRDPFDHLLVAQAIAEAATFMSEDQYAPRYPVAVMRCSRR